MHATSIVKAIGLWDGFDIVFIVMLVIQGGRISKATLTRLGRCCLCCLRSNTARGLWTTVLAVLWGTTTTYVGLVKSPHFVTLLKTQYWITVSPLQFSNIMALSQGVRADVSTHLIVSTHRTFISPVNEKCDNYHFWRYIEWLKLPDMMRTSHINVPNKHRLLTFFSNIIPFLCYWYITSA